MSQNETTQKPSGTSGGIWGLAEQANPLFAAVAVVLPLGLAVVAIVANNGPFLNFVHVLNGAVWVGVSLFMPAVFTPTLAGVPPEARGAIARRMTPKAVFVLPPVVVATLITGPVLAMKYGYWNLASPALQAALALGVIALILGVIISWTQIEMYREISSPPPDPEKLGRLAGRNFKVGVTLAVVQVLVVVSMAALRSGIGVL